MRTSIPDRSPRSGCRAPTRLSLVVMAVALAAVWLAPAPVLAASADEPPSDERITRAVERELIRDEAVPFQGLDVTTTLGVVTLSGEVDNLLARDRAVHIAQGVKGVRSVIDRVQVAPVARSDGELRADVTRALSANPATDSYELNVAVDGGVVTLTGTVDSWTERALSATVAKRVKGVKAVTNDISVEWKDKRPDAEIAADVQAALRWDRLVDDGLVDVEVKGGVVVLRGTVGSAAERRRATEAAWVSGVRLVESDELTVAFWTRTADLRADKYLQPDDAAIEKAIADALTFDPRVLSVQVTPEVERGIVTLTGTLPNAGARDAAVATARNTVGVWSVKDHLHVRPADEIDDVALASSAREALARDPYVDRFDITVGVRNGVATLTGAVDMAYERRRAERVISDLKGIVDVHNFLDVTDRTSRITRQPYADRHEAPRTEVPLRSWVPSWVMESDWEIAEDIRSEIWWSPFVNGDDITVTVSDGVATLTGRVSTWDERRAASENAIEGGAISVDNRLEVAHGPPGPSTSS